MLPVPDASMPASEICSDRSAAGMSFSDSQAQDEKVVVEQSGGVQVECLKDLRQSRPSLPAQLAGGDPGGVHHGALAVAEVAAYERSPRQ